MYACAARLLERHPLRGVLLRPRPMRDSELAVPAAAAVAPATSTAPRDMRRHRSARTRSERRQVIGEADGRETAMAAGYEPDGEPGLQKLFAWAVTELARRPSRRGVSISVRDPRGHEMARWLRLLMGGGFEQRQSRTTLGRTRTSVAPPLLPSLHH
jgi:hypothetical protein